LVHQEQLPFTPTKNRCIFTIRTSEGSEAPDVWYTSHTVTKAEQETLRHTPGTRCQRKWLHNCNMSPPFFIGLFHFHVEERQLEAKPKILQAAAMSRWQWSFILNGKEVSNPTTHH
jgi:hypothetical protein